MKAFVTGGTGFIGANIVRLLLDKGLEVRALCRLGAPLDNLAELDLDIVEGDLEDERSLRRGMEGCELVFHAAALYSFWVRPRERIYRINVDGTRHVMEAALAARVERVIYTSSVATLGPSSGRAPR